jgi:hypothetical protein|nr:MAG TPA: hypothetical protein [Caudoviricetes sp.]
MLNKDWRFAESKKVFKKRSFLLKIFFSLLPNGKRLEINFKHL